MVLSWVLVFELTARWKRSAYELDNTAKRSPVFHPNSGTMVPNTQGRSLVRKKSSGEVVYDVLYRSDAHGRRKVPDEVLNASRYLMLWGDSFAFGVGVQDHENLAAQIQRLTKDYQVYNFGAGSRGPNDVLAELQNPQNARLGGVRQKRGVAVYLYQDFQTHRLFGSTSEQTSARWAKAHPAFYPGPDGAPEFAGTFLEAQPVISRLNSILSQSTLLREVLGLQLPLHSQKHKVAFTARVFEEIRRHLQKIYQIRDFYVVLVPGFCSLFGPELAPLLRDSDIKVLDYNQFDLEKATLGEAFIADEGHPTPESYQVLARMIVQDIAVSQESGSTNSPHRF